MTFFEDSKSYLQYFEENRYSKYLNEKYGEKNMVYSKTEFSKRFGRPPWEIFNEILQETKLNYRLVVPTNDVRIERVYVQFIDLLSKQEVYAKDLSEGEKSILSVVSLLYNLKIKKKIPDIFLFDESDALLHPNYSKKLIDIFKSYLVDKKKKKVILVTHSPSTVAIVPEESLYLCKKEGFTIEKVSKDEALNNLTSNINSLSILHENRRQIFVEDIDDSKIYEVIKKKVSHLLHPEISLNFIPISKTGTGGCAQVKEIVSTLNKYGNSQVFGIIDWDNKNNSSQNILVMGHGNRYSIENYILDPIFVAAYLLREKIIDREDLGLTQTQNYNDIKYLESDQLQIIANFAVNSVKEKADENDNENSTLKYLNGKEVKVPSWFLKIRGHDLETLFEDKFPPIKSRTMAKNNKQKLIFLILNYVIDDLPEFISMDFIEVFKRIQKS